jgi:hypothetical protein
VQGDVDVEKKYRKMCVYATDHTQNLLQNTDIFFAAEV